MYSFLIIVRQTIHIVNLVKVLSLILQYKSKCVCGSGDYSTLLLKEAAEERSRLNSESVQSSLELQHIQSSTKQVL